MPADPSVPDTGGSRTDLNSDQPRRIDRLFTEYGDSHRHPINLLVHWLAVPAIYWCVLALLSGLPFPAAWRLLPGLDWGAVAAALAVLYILTLSVPLAIGMAVASLVGLVIAAAYVRWGEVPLWQFALFVFVFAWVLQFIGHKVEGRRPSFFKDAQFLLIGPAWLLAKVYRMFGIGY